MHPIIIKSKKRIGSRGIARASWHGWFSSWFAFQPALTRLALTAAAALCLHAPVAHSFFLGSPEYRSFLGQPLRIWIPYRLGNDERIDTACVRVLPPESTLPADLPTILNVTPRLQSQKGLDYIVLESTQPLNDPVARIVLDVRCGPTVAVTRVQVIMLDLPPNGAALAVSHPATEISALKPQPGAAGLILPEAAVTSPFPSPVGTGMSRPAEGRKPRQKADTEKPVLRIEPAVREEVSIRNATRACCFRFSLDLAEHAGTPPTEAEREQLRQEMRDRMADDDSVVRMQTLRNELAITKKKSEASAREFAEIQARNDEQARQSQKIRDYVLYTVYLLVALGLVVAVLQWLKTKRQTRRSVAAGIPAVAIAEEAQPPPPPPRASVAKMGPDDPISILSADIFKTKPPAANDATNDSAKP